MSTTSKKIKLRKYTNNASGTIKRTEILGASDKENPKSMKHEKRNEHALPVTATGLEVYKQTW